MRELRDRAEILAALSSESRSLHAYAIGDLDDFFFPATRWFVGQDGGAPPVLLYSGTALPVLLAVTERNPAALASLLEELQSELPARVYAHLTPGLLDVLTGHYLVEPHGRHLKMALREIVPEVAEVEAEQLTPADRQRVERFYAESYPGNWFDPRMLETGMYRGIVDGGELVAVGGIHVFSATHRVAALGNIAVRPSHRGRGLGTAVTRAVCRALADAGVTEIGLNVKADNVAAITCYERLGFVRVAEYDEVMLQRTG